MLLASSPKLLPTSKNSVNSVLRFFFPSARVPVTTDDEQQCVVFCIVFATSGQC